jgi:hypothetical protein
LLKGKKYSNISEPQCFLQHHHIKFFLVRREWVLPGGALLINTLGYLNKGDTDYTESRNQESMSSSQEFSR